MKQKIVILGAKGMLGQALAKAFSAWTPILLDRDEIDITDEQALEIKLLELQPNVIINAAAYTAVDEAETHEDEAMLVNGIAVGYIAKIAQKLGAIVIHYSTDYVFDGTKKEGYDETDAPNPINAYGRTKLRGEQELQKYAKQYYLIRTSWLFGPGGKNFVDTIAKLASERDEIKVVNDQWGKPTHTVDLAAATRKLLEEQKPFGIYHITNETPEGGITWYDFAKKIVEIKGLKTTVVPCTTEEFPRAAKRPRYSGLKSTSKFVFRKYLDILDTY